MLLKHFKDLYYNTEKIHYHRLNDQCNSNQPWHHHCLSSSIVQKVNPVLQFPPFSVINPLNIISNLFHKTFYLQSDWIFSCQLFQFKKDFYSGLYKATTEVIKRVWQNNIRWFLWDYLLDYKPQNHCHFWNTHCNTWNKASSRTHGDVSMQYGNDVIKHLRRYNS